MTMTTPIVEARLPYWVDPYPDDAADTLLTALPAHTCHALIDMAFNPDLLKQLVDPFPTLEMQSLFTGKFEGIGLAELSPHLLTLPVAPEQRRDVIDHLLYHTRGTPMLSFIASPQDHLLRHLQQQLDALNPAGEGFIVRLADSRALHALLQVLTAEQRQRLVPLGMQWWYWKIDGEQVQVDSGAAPNATTPTEPFRFSDEQISQLAALATPGKWLRVLEQHSHHFGQLTGTPSQVCECMREVLKREASRQLHDAELLRIFKTELLQAALVTAA
jgi:hypothetical protein